MKYLFLVIFFLLLAASFGVHFSMPDTRSDAPILYWVTDSNPARKAQAKLFAPWLEKNGYPKIELRLDISNNQLAKKLIQGVSGVAGDVIDQSGGGGDMRYFRAMGLNTDVTEAARRMGFSPDHTYPAIEDELTIDEGDAGRRQYQFPCAVSTALFLVNRETFRQHGQPLPPETWTIEEFERRGIAFVEAANRGLSQRKVFFADQVAPDVLRASFGGSRFNETGTRCTLDEAPNVRALQTIYDWTYKLRLLPTAADVASASTAAGYGGASAQLYNSVDPQRGQYAMILAGRFFLIQMRQFDEARKAAGLPLLDHGVAAPPHGGFPNTSVTARCAMIYAGGKNRDLVLYFLAFLASDDYVREIVRDADAVPSNPAVAQLPEFTQPPDHPNEWDVHSAYANASKNLAVGTAYSPFVLSIVADRLEKDARDKFMNDLVTAPQAAAQAAAAINSEIDRSLAENPRLRPRYDALRARQVQIDEMKTRLLALQASGSPIPDEAKIPVALLENTFFKSYYRHLGWAK